MALIMVRVQLVLDNAHDHVRAPRSHHAWVQNGHKPLGVLPANPTQVDVQQG